MHYMCDKIKVGRGNRGDQIDALMLTMHPVLYLFVDGCIFFKHCHATVKLEIIVCVMFIVILIRVLLNRAVWRT